MAVEHVEELTYNPALVQCAIKTIADKVNELIFVLNNGGVTPPPHVGLSLGHYTSLTMLKNAHPTANVGDYATAGSSTSTYLYWWDGDSWTSVCKLNGATGAKGATGATGETGPAGEAGPQGEVGPQGPEGPQGPRGLTGPMGPQGETGPEGPQGETGPRGDVGPQGPRGLTGPKGDPGIQGDMGEPGYTPVYGKDYFTPSDRESFINTVTTAVKREMQEMRLLWQNPAPRDPMGETTLTLTNPGGVGSTKAEYDMVGIQWVADVPSYDDTPLDYGCITWFDVNIPEWQWAVGAMVFDKVYGRGVKFTKGATTIAVEFSQGSLNGHNMNNGGYDAEQPQYAIPYKIFALTNLKMV